MLILCSCPLYMLGQHAFRDIYWYLYCINPYIYYIITSFLFSLWLCQDSQSATKISGPVLYSALTLYWCILSRMYWILCGRVNTSFFNIATKSLWSVITFISLAKQQWWNILRLCSIPSTPLSILLYLCPALIRFSLTNAMGQRMVLSGVLSLGHNIPSLACSRAILSPIPDASVSR